MCPEWLAHTNVFLTVVGNTHLRWNLVSSFSRAFALIPFPREWGELEFRRRWLIPPPRAAASSQAGRTKIRDYRDEGVNWRLPCALHSKGKRGSLGWTHVFCSWWNTVICICLMQFVLKSWLCCTKGKALMLEVLKHMFGCTVVNCTIKIKDMLKINRISVSLWWNVCALVFVGLCE